MKTYLTVHKSYDTEVLQTVECDICKKKFKNENWDRTSSFDVLETEVSMRKGEQYPECGSADEISFDICPTCFEKKLIPALKEMGASPSHTVSEW